MTTTTTIQPQQRNMEADFQYRLYWLMTRRCNFDCPYCFRQWSQDDRQTEESALAKYTADHLARQFDATGKKWLVYMTGGEPLLYPNFIALAKALTRNHHLTVSTNLSTANAFGLADAVEPKRFAPIMANVHITQREKLTDGLKEFLRKFLYFQKLGFDIRLVYVAYPPLFDRIEQDLRLFREQGVGQIVIKIFQGKLDGKRFPRDYTEQQRDFLINLGLKDSEKWIMESRVSFLGKKCLAGNTAFNMDPAGRITRCNTFNENYGNLFEETFKPDDLPRRCTAKKCACPYQGFHLTKTDGFPVPPNIIVRPLKFAITFAESVCRTAGWILK